MLQYYHYLLPPYPEDITLILYQFLSVALYHFTSVANNFKEVFDLLQQKQEEFLKITTITKQNIENSLTDLESAFNTNKKTLDVLFEKIQKLGDDKVDLLKIDKKIKDIANNNFISKKLTDLYNYVNCLVDNQKPQDDTPKMLGDVDSPPLE